MSEVCLNPLLQEAVEQLMYFQNKPFQKKQGERCEEHSGNKGSFFSSPCQYVSLGSAVSSVMLPNISNKFRSRIAIQIVSVDYHCFLYNP